MIKLSISNIAWSKDQDDEMYSKIKEMGFHGIEIAPSRIFGERPYDKLDIAKDWALSIREKFGLEISSMQSIWYGRKENLFHTIEERENLFDYSVKAINFARAISCGNLVFGCPRNRFMENKSSRAEEDAIVFFKAIGATAQAYGIKFGIEPNPTIYNTNYLNTTDEVHQLLASIGNSGLGINLDLGTILYNSESLESIRNFIHQISHVHISEPGLAVIQKRKEHKILFEILQEERYDKFVSIEMSKCESVSEVQRVMDYIKGVCTYAES